VHKVLKDLIIQLKERKEPQEMFKVLKDLKAILERQAPKDQQVHKVVWDQQVHKVIQVHKVTKEDRVLKEQQEV
jgi:hypothetical protein